MKPKRLLLSFLTLAAVAFAGCSSPDDAALGSALLHGLAGAPTATFGQSLLLHTAGDGLDASAQSSTRSGSTVPELPADLLGSYANVDYWQGGQTHGGIFYVYIDRFVFAREDGGVMVVRWHDLSGVRNP
jgi:hypothetical protein